MWTFFETVYRHGAMGRNSVYFDILFQKHQQAKALISPVRKLLQIELASDYLEKKTSLILQSLVVVPTSDMDSPGTERLCRSNCWCCLRTVLLVSDWESQKSPYHHIVAHICSLMCQSAYRPFHPLQDILFQLCYNVSLSWSVISDWLNNY